MKECSALKNRADSSLHLPSANEICLCQRTCESEVESFFFCDISAVIYFKCPNICESFLSFWGHCAYITGSKNIPYNFRCSFELPATEALPDSMKSVQILDQRCLQCCQYKAIFKLKKIYQYQPFCSTGSTEYQVNSVCADRLLLLNVPRQMCECSVKSVKAFYLQHVLR